MQQLSTAVPMGAGNCDEDSQRNLGESCTSITTNPCSLQPPPSRSTWTIANSCTSDSNGSSTTTRGRRRFRQRRRACQMVVQEQRPKCNTIESMEVAIRTRETCSHMIDDGDISSLSDFYDEDNDESSDDSSVSTPRTKVAIWWNITPQQSNVTRKLSRS